jgi:hypothetical protein
MAPVFTGSSVANGTGACLQTDTENAGFINNPKDLNCTSEDLDIAVASASTYCTGGPATDCKTLASTGGKIQCEAGTHVWVTTTAQVQNHANSRYDVGLWIGELGGDAKTGTSCLHFNLIENSNGSLDLDNQTNDSCGDVAANTNVNVPLGQLELLCVDGNPAADTSAIVVSACAGWLNSESPGNRDGICPVAGQTGNLGFRYGTTPENSAKCKCTPLELPLDIRGSITIVKNTVGGNGTFAFTHDVGSNSDPTVTSPFNITTVSNTGSQVFAKVPEGTYHITESAPPSGWSFTSLSCTAGGSVNSQTATITLAAGANVTCTFTNTKIPTLTVNKVCVPTSDTGKFNLQIDGSTAGGADKLCGQGTGAQEVSIGGHTVGETAGTGTVLSNYTSVISGDCASNGSVSLAAGDNKTCTITNTRKPTLTVNKVCVPTSDTGKFNLQIDASTVGGADKLCGQGTGAQIVSIGTHTVGEVAGTGTSLADYASAISGDCASNGTVTLAAGDNKTCTITNTKKATLTVNKVCVPTSDNGKFNLQIDGSTVGGADKLCGQGTGAQTVTATTHTVGEVAGTGTVLSNYTSVISGDCASNGTVTLNPGDNKVCTITNTRKPTLTVNKVCVPTSDTGKFNLQIDASTVGGADKLCGQGTGAQIVSIGGHTVGEVAGTGTVLSNYTSVIGGDCASNGSVSLAAGDNKVCTITNTRKPTLTVNKVCVPTSDTGKFNLQIDASTVGGADKSCGQGTGAQIVTIGSHTVGETAGTGNDLARYSSAISGDCASSGVVSLAAGENKTCTITNSRLPNLTVVKTVIGAGATFAFTGTGTGVSANFNLSPASDASASTTFSNIATGTKTVTETGLAQYVLTDLSCVKNGGAAVPGDLSTKTVSVALDYGDNATCTFINQHQVSQTTRTQGFWATHTSIALAAFNGGTFLGNTYAGMDHFLCGKELDFAKLMGGFWSNIAKTSTGAKRSDIDKARMQLLQQLLAAELNGSAFGSSPSPLTTAQAETAFCTGTIDDIKAAQVAMAAFNESGDSGAFTPGASATPKDSKDVANYGYWDTLP